jgi:GntR family transcriptional repressor for pyruvate dehydrogenase complex
MDPFHPVKSAKISELIVRQIKNAIRNGTMRPGDRLPPERKLVQRFQASRISVREALKGLEASGLIVIKPGSGVFVSEISLKPISDSLSSVLRMQRTSMNELTEARIILEPYIAKLATEKITPEDLKTLEQNVHETSKIVESNTPSPAENIEFHSLIAAAAQNQVITLTMRTLFDVIKEMTMEKRSHLQKRTEISREAVSYHKKILKALRERNSEKVYELMLKHIIQIQDGLKILTSKTR